MVPGYLGFISGVSLSDLSPAGGSAIKDPQKIASAKRKIFINAVLFVIGFSAVFITMGSLFGLGGATLVRYRVWLGRIGGIFVILFGLSMMGLFKISFFQKQRSLRLPVKLTPGQPLSSLVFGSAFAFGWTPCVGPVLGSILLLASSSATVAQGALLLMVFSLGLAIPFLLVAAGISSASSAISRFSKYFKYVEIVSGTFLILLGLLLVTNNFAMLISYGYQLFGFIEYDRLLDFL
jgi:cytochrome c-type biogenesis protein